MLERLEGIVLRTIKYSDTSKIITLYSKESGKVGLFLNNPSGKKKRTKQNFLNQPLSHVELIVSKKKQSSAVGSIRESKLLFPAIDIQSNILKAGVAMFLSEVLQKAIREEEDNDLMFVFIRDSAIALNEIKENLQFFPLQFMVQLSGYLGFQPDETGWQEGAHFDLLEGEFISTEPLHKHALNPTMSACFVKLIHSNYGDELGLPKNARTTLMDKMLEYYQLHLPSFGKIKSLEVLSTVMA